MNSIANRAIKMSPSLTLEITAKANKMKADGIDVVSFGVGEPDCDTPSFIREKAIEALNRGITRYTPSVGTVELRRAVCQKLESINSLKYDESQIVISNGAKHSLYNALMATINEGDEVIIPSPYWLTYPELVKLCGGIPVFVTPCNQQTLKVTAQEIERAITSKTKAIIFNNPTNPSGVVFNKQEVVSIAKLLEKSDIYVIADETYEEFSYYEPIYSLACYSQKLKDNTIVVNGMSKTYAMTGWRIGYTASTKQLASAMGSIQSHATSNPNSIAQYASVEALTNPKGREFIVSTKERFKERRDLMLEELQKIPSLRVVEPQGAFYMMADISKLLGTTIEKTKIDSAHTLSSLMLDKIHVVTIPCESFGVKNYIRFSYACSEAAIKKGMARLRDFLSCLK